MKYFIILIVIVVGVAGIIYWMKGGGGPTEDLVVDTYFHNLEVPLWTPMGRAYEARGEIPPGYNNLQQMRHFVIVVNVPAKRLLAVDQTPDEPDTPPESTTEPESGSETEEESSSDKVYKMTDGRNYPQFVVVSSNGSERIPRGVFAWPRKGNALAEKDFQDSDDWFPAPREDPTKRYRVALYFRCGKGFFDGPFQVKMDDDQIIEVTKEKYDQMHLWEY